MNKVTTERWQQITEHVITFRTVTWCFPFMQNLEDRFLRWLREVTVIIWCFSTCGSKHESSQSSLCFRTRSILAGCNTCKSGSACSFASLWYTNLISASLRGMLANTGSALWRAHCSRWNFSCSSSNFKHLSCRSSSRIRASLMVSVRAFRWVVLGPVTWCTLRVYCSYFYYFPRSNHEITFESDWVSALNWVDVFAF